MKFYFSKDFKEVYPLLCPNCREIAKMCYYNMDEDSTINNLCDVCFDKLVWKGIIEYKLSFKEKLSEKMETIVDFIKEYWMTLIILCECIIFLILVSIGVL